MAAQYNQSTVVIYKPVTKKKSKSKLKSAKYSSLSNLDAEYDENNLSEEEHHDINTSSKHSKSGRRSLIFSRSKISKLSTHSKTNSKSSKKREKSKSKSHRSMKSLTKSISRKKLDKSRSERKKKRSGEPTSEQQSHPPIG
eukprot:128865_1